MEKTQRRPILKAQTRGSTGALLALCTVMVLAIAIFASAACAQAPDPCNTADPCGQTSTDALNSCRYGVRDAYWLALGKCENLASCEDRLACMKQARQERLEGFEECSEQFEARQEICDALGPGAYDPIIDPANFVTTINNPYFPLTPGITYIYEGNTAEGVEHIEVQVTHETKEILGVQCVVVKDTVTVNGELVEDTLDWYAQDKQGNVWYFGELSKEFADGELVSLSGSWKAGVDGAKAGIVMKANPQVGDVYRQEFALGEAEDMGQVLSLNKRFTAPIGTFRRCLLTKDFTPLEPGVAERKLYAPGIGFVQSTDLESGEQVRLVEIRID